MTAILTQPMVTRSTELAELQPLKRRSRVCYGRSRHMSLSGSHKDELTNILINWEHQYSILLICFYFMYGTTMVIFIISPLVGKMWWENEKLTQKRKATPCWNGIRFFWCKKCTSNCFKPQCACKVTYSTSECFNLSFNAHGVYFPTYLIRSEM
jgi:hypothetical protein